MNLSDVLTELRRLRELLEELLSEVRHPWQPWMDDFLESLQRSGGNATVAIDLCGKCRDTVYKYRRQNRLFARRWDAVKAAVRKAKRQRADRLEKAKKGRQPP